MTQPDELAGRRDSLASTKAFAPLRGHATITLVDIDTGSISPSRRPDCLEISDDWRVTDGWRIVPACSYLHVRRVAPPRTEAEGEGSEPAHQVSLRSLLKLGDAVDFDSTLRYVDHLPGLSVDRYVNLDLRLGWHPAQSLEISLVGQNLLQSHHAEFAPELIPTTAAQIQRGVYAKLDWRF